MKKFVLLFVVLFAFGYGQTKAQNWAPDGAEWYYDYVNFYYVGYIHITVTGDTVINDTACRILNRYAVIHNLEFGTTSTFDHGNAYMYSDEDKVYIFENNRFYTLYDFSASVGDTINIPQNSNIGNIAGGGCDSVGMIVVTDTSSMVINGERLRRIYVDPCSGTHWAIYGYIVEKIGPLNSYMLPEPNYCVVDLYEGGPLRCYSDPDFGLYSTGISPECDFLVSVPKLENLDIKIYPNPCDGVFSLQIKNNQSDFIVSIYDAIGRSVFQQRMKGANNIITSSTLIPGIYILKIELNDWVINKRLVVK